MEFLPVHLWRNRESPPTGSRRWFVVWAKRLLNAPALLRMCLRNSWLRARGGRLAQLVVIQACKMQGPVRRLSVGAASFIGADCTLMLHESIAVGSHVVINARVTILTASHRLRDPRWGMYRRSVEIGDYAWIATGAMLLPGTRIGRGAVVGAGAVVRGHVPDYAVVTGNPATVTGSERCRNLDYNPVAFAAPIEAWLGPAGMGLGGSAAVSGLPVRVEPVEDSCHDSRGGVPQ